MTTKPELNGNRLILISMAILVICSFGILHFHAVDNSLSEEDRRFIPKYLDRGARLPEDASYAEELDFIVSVQRSVLHVAPGNAGLPFGQKREPKELYEAGSGLCYDRSRVIEKILRYYGFETRHVSLFSKKEAGSAIRALITPGVSSHAITEVLTRNGWLVVDSNDPWVSIDSRKQPISIRRMQDGFDGAVAIDWSVQPPSDIYIKPFSYVYGLYSRHGHFYPPYSSVPDVQLGEFAQNADIIASFL